MNTINPGIKFDLEWVNSIKVNRSAVERRALTLSPRRSIKNEWQAAWLLKALTLIDLTTLSGDDTPSNVKRLCSKALNPLNNDLIIGLGLEKRKLTVAAVCVYHSLIKSAKEALMNSKLPLAAVSAGFPAGLSPVETRLKEIELSILSGATEIDIVINRNHVLKADWINLYNEIKLFREACKNTHLKTIIATGDIMTFRNIAKASLVCMMAGADFIKTSTGKENINSTIPFSLVMVRAIRDYFDKTNFKVGFKAAGGIKSAKESISYLTLIKEELGNDWLNPSLFRIGASSLLGDIERQLDHYVTGSYSASNRHSMA